MYVCLFLLVLLLLVGVVVMPGKSIEVMSVVGWILGALTDETHRRIGGTLRKGEREWIKSA
jgi:hypothetical protein